MDSYMVRSPQAVEAACSKCGKRDHPSAFVEVFASGRRWGDMTGPISELECLTCWHSRGQAPAVSAPEAPKPRHPKACLAASQHKTYADACARADRVAYVLAQRPEVTPADPNAPGPFWCIGDSELVSPKVKLVTNPLI